MRCARNECDNTELTTKTATLRARSRVHVVLRVASLDLGFHVVIGVGRLNVQQEGVDCISPRIRNTKCKVLFFRML